MLAAATGVDMYSDLGQDTAAGIKGQLQDMQPMQAVTAQQSLGGQAGQMMSAPLMDPTKNPDAAAG